MMIPLKETLDKYGLTPTGVIQVGAHWAEEHEEFIKCGIERFVYIEPCKEAFDVICEKLGWGKTPEEVVRSHYEMTGVVITNQQKDNVLICNVACGPEEKEMPMYVSHQNQGQSNSLLKPNLHLQQHPEVVFDDAELVNVIPLDKLPIDKSQYDFLYMDVQGFEGEVLSGGYETLKNINVIYTEINRGQTYDGNMEIDELDGLLEAHGFKRAETYWPSPNWTWGDALYIKQ